MGLASIFTGLSLFSYKQSDPSYSNIVFNRYYSDKAGNMFGKAGAYVSDYLGMFFGWSSLLVPFILFASLLLMGKLYRNRISVLRVLGAICAMVFAMLSFSVLSGLAGTGDPFFTDKAAGGIFGIAGSVVISSVLGKAGGIILASVVLFLSILGVINLSMMDFFQKVADRINRIGEESDPKIRTTDKHRNIFSSLLSVILKKFYAWSDKRAERKRMLELKKEHEKYWEEERKKEEAEAVYNKAIESAGPEETGALQDLTDPGMYIQEFTQNILLTEGQSTDYAGGSDARSADARLADARLTDARLAVDITDENAGVNADSEHVDIPPFDSKQFLTVLELEELINKEQLTGRSLREEELRLLGEELANTEDSDLPIYEQTAGVIESAPIIESRQPERSPAAKLHMDGLRSGDSLPDGDADDYQSAGYTEGIFNEPDYTQSDENDYAGEFYPEKSSGKLHEFPAVSTIEHGQSADLHAAAKAVPVNEVEDYYLPLDLLDSPSMHKELPDYELLNEKAEQLVQTLNDFGVSCKVKEIHPGPVVTMFELELASGVKINKIANLENDLALSLSAMSIRILAPIPGKAAVGVEIPNPKREMIFIKELLDTDKFRKNTSPLAVALGQDIGGNPYFSDLTKMPHLLVAGTTGSGKSVCVNTIICSILYKSSPDKVKFILIDPKMVELSVYEGIPHLAAPVVTEPKKAAAVLNNVVKEMESRYSLLASCRVKSIATYNSYVEENPEATDPDGEELKFMPYMVVIVDEFADLMMVAGKEVEASICRIAQMARAVGIHLVLATQRPSVNVITGIIKANMPARISFRVSSKIDSRTIIDQNGAEVLLGKGDSLFIPPGSSDPIRIHGCFVSEGEVLRVVDRLKLYGTPDYDMALLEEKSQDESGAFDEESDPRFDEALSIVKERGFASISMIQRYLRIGYNRAARIVEDMERRGLVTASDGTSKPRDYIGE